jgi:putative membrane protein
MALYELALMGLALWVPPLFWWGFLEPLRLPKALAWLLDPWVALALFGGVVVGTSLPGLFAAGLEGSFGAALPWLYLITGLLFWLQLVRGWGAGWEADWKVGLYGLVAMLPMNVVGLVWLWSTHVLYSPYLNVICLWNLSPLEDQRLAGAVMLLTGLPPQLWASWLLVRGFMSEL